MMQLFENKLVFHALNHSARLIRSSRFNLTALTAVRNLSALFCNATVFTHKEPDLLPFLLPLKETKASEVI